MRVYALIACLLTIIQVIGVDYVSDQTPNVSLAGVSASFVDYFCFVLLCFHVRLFVDALWSPVCDVKL